MIESPTKRQDNSSGQIDGDYGRPSKKQRMSVEPSEMSTLEPKDSVNLSILDDTDSDEEEFQPVEVTRASDLYLDTVRLVISIVKNLIYSHCSKINRAVLDFDFEKVCSVSLSNINIYGCLVCGKYFQGRGRNSYAYSHSIHDDHHVFINLETTKAYPCCFSFVLHILIPVYRFTSSLMGILSLTRPWRIYPMFWRLPSPQLPLPTCLLHLIFRDPPTILITKHICRATLD